MDHHSFVNQGENQKVVVMGTDHECKQALRHGYMVAKKMSNGQFKGFTRCTHLFAQITQSSHLSILNVAHG